MLLYCILMKKKVFAGLICLMILSSTIICAQDTLNVKVIINSYYRQIPARMVAVIDPVNDSTLFDTLTVELHSTVNGNVIYSKKTVFDIYGNGSVIVPLNLSGNSYYLVIKHRNSIETWSSSPLNINGTTNYDFTSSISQAYGDNLDTTYNSNLACIYCGDIDQNGYIDTLDFLLWDSANTVFGFGPYEICDLNGDFNVDMSDFTWIDNGIINMIRVRSPFITYTFEIEQLSELRIFPNPANSYCKFYINNMPNKGVLEIYTLMGILKNIINIDGNSNKIDVSDYPAGMYILKYSTGNEIFSQKLVVEH